MVQFSVDYKNGDKLLELEQKIGMKPKPQTKLEFIIEEEVKSLENNSVNSNLNSNSNLPEEMTYLQFSKQESENIDDFNQLDFIDDKNIIEDNNFNFNSIDEIKKSCSSSISVEKEIDIKITKEIKKTNNSNSNPMFVKPEDD